MLALRANLDDYKHYLRLWEKFRLDPRSIRDNGGRYGVLFCTFKETSLGLVRGVTDFFSFLEIFTRFG